MLSENGVRCMLRYVIARLFLLRSGYDRGAEFACRLDVEQQLVVLYNPLHETRSSSGGFERTRGIDDTKRLASPYSGSHVCFTCGFSARQCFPFPFKS